MTRSAADHGTPRKRAPGAPRGNRNAQKHGVYALGRRLKNAGLAKVDGRSALERIKRDWKAAVRATRGELTPQQEALLEIAANTWLMISTADDWILDHGPINRRRGDLRPIVERRGKLVRTLKEALSAIGLDGDVHGVPADGYWDELRRRHPMTTRRAIAPSRGSQDDDEGGSDGVAATDLEPMGPLALSPDGCSISHEFRDDSEEPPPEEKLEKPEKGLAGGTS